MLSEMQSRRGASFSGFITSHTALFLLVSMMFLLVETAPALAAVSAGPITNPSNGHLYYAISPNTWTNAEAEAQSLGGHLVTINDATENSWVWQTFAPLVGGPLWIGLSDAAQEGTFVWASGQPAAYLNWWCRSSSDCEPNNQGGLEHYVEMNNHVWNDNDNGKIFHSVAEVEVALPEIVITPGPPITVTTTPVVVNNGPGIQDAPHLDGNLVAYMSPDPASYGGWEARYFNFATNIDSLIPRPATGMNYFPDVSGNIIAFTRLDACVSSIWTFDTSTAGPAIELAPEPVVELTPSWTVQRRNAMIGSATVAWFEYNSYCVINESLLSTPSEVVVYDLPSGTGTRLTNDALWDQSPAVSSDGKVVVWAKRSLTYPYPSDIWQAVKGSTGWTVSQVTNAPGNELHPQTNGTLVVYDSPREGNAAGTDIYWKPVAGGAERQLAMDGIQFAPTIWGSIIAFRSMNINDPIPNNDLYLYDLSTSNLYRLTDTPSIFEQNIDISAVGSEFRVVWSNWDYYEGNVYTMTFALPVANAGPDQMVHNGSVVTLDGGASSDPDKNYPLGYAWTITAAPVGSTATLADPAVVNPSFTADLPGDYTIKLVVKDASGFLSVADSVTVSTTNTLPVADAGPDQAVTLTGATVQLAGSGSYDLEGDPLTYQWTLVQKPLGSSAALSNPAISNPTFIADAHGDYVLTLVVSDPWSSSAADTVTMSFSNSKPVADAGGNQSVVAGSLVELSGAGSSDANGDALTCTWSFVSRPWGSSAVLATSLPAAASFTADEAGTYVVSLVVNDGFIDSDPRNVTVEATGGTDGIIEILTEAIGAINRLAPGSFKNGAMANTLTNKINAAIQMVDQGHYEDALDKLRNDILGKTDGCATAGGLDKNDWIASCAAQNQVYPLIIEAIDLLSLL